MMHIFRQMRKSNSERKLTIFVVFLLMSFFIQTSLPRVTPLHHAHKGGQTEHQHTEFAFKPAAEHVHDERGHHAHPHQSAHAHNPKRIDSKAGETSLRQASVNIEHDHHKHFFLGKFVSETPLQQDIFSFRWLGTADDQNQQPAHRLGIHIRGPPFSLT